MSFTGDYYKVGERRKKELIKSCGILGIPDRNVSNLNILGEKLLNFVLL
jgi:LmbE family N-acetylglucosaminyl deacetylase